MDRSYTQEYGEMNRDDWEFEYTAKVLAQAAEAQRDFRKTRVEAWERKKVEVMAKIKESGIEVHESVANSFASYTTSNAAGPQIVIDPMMQRDLTECQTKIAEHRKAATAYDGWAQVLNANPESRLKLKHNDWMYFFGK